MFFNWAVIYLQYNTLTCFWTFINLCKSIGVGFVKFSLSENLFKYGSQHIMRFFSLCFRWIFSSIEIWQVRQLEYNLWYQAHVDELFPAHNFECKSNRRFLMLFKKNFLWTEYDNILIVLLISWGSHAKNGV